MSTPIEIPIIIVHTGETGFTQIAPTSGPDRLPAARVLDLTQPDIEELVGHLQTWINNPDNHTAQTRLKNHLRRTGKKSIKRLLHESLGSILNLSAQEGWRRILVYTDSESSKIPLEAIFLDSGETLAGGEIGFITTNHNWQVSIVRHLGLEATDPMPIKKNQPLQMLIVFSNPNEPGYRLGSIYEKDGCVEFEDHLEDEQRALDDTLGPLIRLNLLELYFLIGNEANSTVFDGQVKFNHSRNQLCWRITNKHERNEEIIPSLKDIFINRLNQRTWHILHYLGHGDVSSTSPQLVLRPGDNLSSNAIGQLVENENGQQATSMPRLVVLNACESASSANSNVPVLTGFATVFLMRGTVNLVCMQMKVTPETATLTTRTLYGKLLMSLFTDQMNFEEALLEFRRAAYGKGRLDFFCPVLYARPVNGPIFDFQDGRLDTWKQIIGIKKGNRLPWNPKSLRRMMALYPETK